MDIQKLATLLLAGHPVTGPFDADDAVAAAQGNLKNCSRTRETMSGDKVFCQADKAEFAALGTEKQNLWVSFCGRDVIDSSRDANVDFVKWVFGDASQTVSNLQAARTETVSYFVKEGLGFVAPGHVENARY